MTFLPITTVILAGGRGVRIGGNKGLQLLRGKPLLEWVLKKVRPGSQVVLINANTELGAYQHFGCEVITDRLPDWQGPLAGLHAALWHAHTEYVMTVPCDTPFLPEDLILQLWNAIQSADVDAVVATTGGYRQPAVAMYRKRVLPSLEKYLNAGERKVNAWLDTLQTKDVPFKEANKFNNINTLEDLRQAGCDVGA